VSDLEINGVFSGGGMKGYALIGAIQAAEEHGFHFKKVAGTSAGSIVAAFLTAGFTSEEIYKIMIDAPRKSFLDSSFRVLPFINWLMLYWNMGLYKGNALEKWLGEKLARKGVRNFGDIEPGSLKVIVSNVSNNQLVVIPDDLPKYQIDPRKFSIAKAVRMSASIPYIFRPVKLKKNLIVDGGLLSNFPVWLFESKDYTKKAKRPVIGIRLTPKEKTNERRDIHNSLELFSALFSTMLNAHDLRYISRKVEKNIMFIPVQEGISADFDLPKEECEKLVQLGKQTAIEFFKTWRHTVKT